MTRPDPAGNAGVATGRGARGAKLDSVAAPTASTRIEDTSGDITYIRTDPGLPPVAVIDRSPIDPYWISSPWVLFDEGRWRMWYVSGLGWHFEGRRAEHYIVHVRYAESDDGISWRRDGRGCIDFASPDATVAARAAKSLVVEGDVDAWRAAFASLKR